MNTDFRYENEKITTSLLAIVRAIEEELSADEKDLMPSIITHLIDSGRIKLTCETNDCRALLN